MSEGKAICRGCGIQLEGKPYYMGGSAYHPITRKQAKICHYGGFVCSKSCDRRACLELESSMPGCAGQKNLTCYAQESMRKWEEN